MSDISLVRRFNTEYYRVFSIYRTSLFVTRCITLAGYSVFEPFSMSLMVHNYFPMQYTHGALFYAAW